MQIFSAPQLALHAPARELHNGGFAPAAETPARLAAILDAVGEARLPTDQGLDPILAVHDAAYVDFLKRAHNDWRAAGRPGDAIGYVFPTVRRRLLSLNRIDAELGLYAIDAGSPIAEGTWETSYWNAQTALAGLERVLSGAPHAFALTRPPGHHAGRDYLGGYCYLNTTAIAAQAALARGANRVAILDVDYHHGNGTQDIFYAREAVAFASIHADPRTDYPFYWGHADETGEGKGAGATLNRPLPRGTGWTDYRPALGHALDWLSAQKPDLLIVSYGADTYREDPISFFELDTPDYTAMATDIAQLGLPTLIIMEGGYAIGALGANVSAFLAGFGR